MSSEAAACIALAVYLAAGASVVAWQIRRSRVGWGAWLLYFVERLYLGVCQHWRANRRCPFPTPGPAIIIANHRSPLDPMLVWMNHHLVPGGEGPLRVINFLMAREYYEKPGLRWLCRTMRSIPAARDGRDIGPAKAVLSRLKAGELVGIFPEGHLNEGPGLLPADPGVAWLALRAEVPVYPVFIHNAPQGGSMVRPFLHSSRVRVSYGEPIDLSRYRGRRKSDETLREVTSLLMHRLAELGGLTYEGAERPREGILPLAK